MKDMNEMMNEMMSKMMEQMAQQMMMQMMQSMMASFGVQNNFQPKAEEEKVSEDDKHVNAAVACSTSNVTCKWTIEEKLNGGKKFYAIKDGIFTCGQWRDCKNKPGRQYRKTTNGEAHRIALGKVKALDGIEYIIPDGESYRAYGFSSKKKAEAAIKKLPEKIDRAEIAAFITEFGAIEPKFYYRDKPQS